MKKGILFFLFTFISTLIFSQTDTLFLLKSKKIACKIIEINDFDIKYKQAQNPDGPLYVVNKSNVIKYSLSNGFIEYIVPDELSLENEHAKILDKRQVIKISPFSPAFNNISLGYEKVIKVGMNMDITAGYINSGINTDATQLFKAAGNNSTSHSGVFFKPGIKFFLGEDFSIKGLKYAHPLKGRYIKLDLAFSYISFVNLSRVYYNNYAYYGATSTQTVYTNMNTFAYGGFVNYGRQFILGNLFTLDYYIGAGFTGQNQMYTNSNFFRGPFATSNYTSGETPNNTSNYYGFIRVPNFGLSFTGGFRLGYIISRK